jgi:spore germination protein YaaH
VAIPAKPVAIASALFTFHYSLFTLLLIFSRSISGLKLQKNVILFPNIHSTNLKMKINIPILFFFAAALIQAQQVPTYKSGSNLYKKASDTLPHLSGSVSKSSNSNSTSNLSRSVFGFLPWWEYSNGDFKNLEYSLLTHIAVFSFEADSTGSLTDPPGKWPWTDFIGLARANKVKIIMTVTCFDSSSIHKLLNDSIVRGKMFEGIKSRLIADSLDGVNFDFENLIDADKRDILLNFFIDFKSFFAGFNCEVSFSSPAVTYGKWNFDSVARYCDYLFVMCYDYYGSWSYTTGPNSPLSGSITGYSYDVYRTFTVDYASIVSSNPEKLILGVPYYGNYWTTSVKDPYAPVAPFDVLKKKNNWQNVMYYRDIAPVASREELIWDSVSQTPWVRWRDTLWNQIWYDNDSSLALKFDFAVKNNLKGIGIWALGYDNGRNEFWNLIDRKFNRPVSVRGAEPSAADGYILNQNYPNPFNPATTIIYRIPNAETGNQSAAGPLQHVTLKVYDLLGREITTLVNEDKLPGNYKAIFNITGTRHPLSNGQSLPSGVYFYTLHAGSFFQSKKMMVIR